jgi:glycosyltransferase involved in cell wall biosynthesis
MKILMLNANRVGIGTYHRALHFGRELARQGHDVKLMTVSNDHRFRQRVRTDVPRLTIVECPNLLDELLPWHASGILDIGLRIRELWRGGYDVVYAFEYQPNISIPVLLARRFRRFTLISDWCDWHAGAGYHFGGYRIAHAIDRRFEEHIRHHADFVTTINQVLHDRALAIGLPAARLAVVGEGVDPAYIVPGDRDAARAELALPAGALIGTIRDAPLATALLCAALRDLPRARLLVIGANPDGARADARRAGVAERVIATGRVSDEHLPRYLAACDVLALPLEDNLVNRGRWPHKLGDMLAAQRPVVTSTAGEFPALIAQHAAGVIAELSPRGFAVAIGDLLERPEAAAAIARRGRALIERDLNWDVIGAHLGRVVERARAS